MNDVSTSIESLMGECNRYHAQMQTSIMRIKKKKRIVASETVEDKKTLLCCATKERL